MSTEDWEKKRRKALCHLRKRFSGRYISEIQGNSGTAQNDVYDLLKRTVDGGEGSSAIVIGPRGAGKTAIVENALSDLRKGLRQGERQFLEIRIHGCVHTSDRLALMEIARALKVNFGPEEENDGGTGPLGSFSSILDAFITALQEGTRLCPALIFILDEIDLLARPGRQTLLYNLFDLSLSSMVPMAIVGLTCRLDVADLFEKRVKSRFSHNIILVHNAVTFKQYLKQARLAFSLKPGYDPAIAKESSSFMAKWNRLVKELFSDAKVMATLEHQYQFNSSLQGLHNLLRPTLYHLDPSQPEAMVASICATFAQTTMDDTQPILEGLSVLEFCVLIAAAYAAENRETGVFDFENVFDEYRQFLSKLPMATFFFDKAVVYKAYAQLLDLELITEVRSSKKQHGKLPQYIPCRLMVDEELLATVAAKHAHIPQDVSKWVARLLRLRGHVS